MGWAIALGFDLGQEKEMESGLSWTGIRSGLKEMGLEGAMGEMGSGCLQFCFRTLFNVLAPIFFKNIQSMQGQFLQKIDLNTFPSIYDTFSRSKQNKYGEFFN